MQQYELVDGKDPERERALKRDDGRAFAGWEDDPHESIHRAVAAAVDAAVVQNRAITSVRMLEESASKCRARARTTSQSGTRTTVAG